MILLGTLIIIIQMKIYASNLSSSSGKQKRYLEGTSSEGEGNSEEPENKIIKKIDEQGSSESSNLNYSDFSELISGVLNDNRFKQDPVAFLSNKSSIIDSEVDSSGLTTESSESNTKVLKPSKSSDIEASHRDIRALCEHRVGITISYKIGLIESYFDWFEKINEVEFVLNPKKPQLLLSFLKLFKKSIETLKEICLECNPEQHYLSNNHCRMCRILILAFNQTQICLFLFNCTISSKNEIYEKILLFEIHQTITNINFLIVVANKALAKFKKLDIDSISSNNNLSFESIPITGLVKKYRQISALENILNPDNFRIKEACQTNEHFFIVLSHHLTKKLSILRFSLKKSFNEEVTDFEIINEFYSSSRNYDLDCKRMSTDSKNRIYRLQTNRQGEFQLYVLDENFMVINLLNKIVAKRIFDRFSVEIEDFSICQDILYILDSKNTRILVCDLEFNALSVFTIDAVNFRSKKSFLAVSKKYIVALNDSTFYVRRNTYEAASFLAFESRLKVKFIENFEFIGDDILLIKAVKSNFIILGKILEVNNSIVGIEIKERSIDVMNTRGCKIFKSFGNTYMVTSDTKIKIFKLCLN